MAEQNQFNSQQDPFTPENIAKVDTAIEQGQLSEEEIPAHVQTEMARRGSKTFQYEDPDTELDYLPQDESQIEAYAEPITDMNGGRSYSTPANNERKVQAAAIKAMQEGKSIVQAIAELEQQGELGIPEQALQDQAYDRQYSEAAEYESLKENVDLSQEPESAVDELQAADDLAREARERRDDFERVFVDSVSSPEIQESRRQGEVANRYLLNVLRKTMEDTGGVEKFSDFLTMFIPGAMLKDNYDLTGEIWDGRQVVENLHNNYWNASPEERIQILKGLESKLEELPYLQKVELLSNLKDPGAAEETGQYHPAWSAVDMVSLGLAGVDIALLARNMYKTSRATKLVKELADDPEDIADGVATAAADRSGKARDYLDMDDDNIFNTSLPFNTEDLDVKSIDGVSVPVMSRINQYLRLVSNVIKRQKANQLFLREGKFTEREKDAIEQQFAQQVRDTHGIDNVEVSRDGDKIFVSFDEVRTDGVKVATKSTKEYRKKTKQLRNAITDLRKQINAEKNTVRRKELGKQMEELKAERALHRSRAEEVTEGAPQTTRVTEELELKIDEDTGSWTIEDPGWIKRHLASNTVWAKGTFREVSDQAQRLDLAQAKVTDQLRALHAEAIKVLTGGGLKGLANTLNPAVRKSINKIDSVLLTGDKNKRVYTVEELESGVSGVKLNEKEIEAYYKMRVLNDTLYELRNDETRRSLVSAGIKQVSLEGGSKTLLGKPLADHIRAASSVNQLKGKHYYDEVTGTYGEFQHTDLKTEYLNGKVLVKLKNKESFGGVDNDVAYVFVSADEISELPHKVIHYRNGYVPKISDESAYFVKATSAGVDDGVQKSALSKYAETKAKTVRAFDNKHDAKVFAEMENKKLREQGIDADTKTFDVYGDRQLEKERAVSAVDDEASFIGGHGLYTGPRAQEEVLWGLEGVERPRQNAFESVSRNISALSKFLTRNEWREAVEAKAVETANRLMSKDPDSITYKTFEDLSKAETSTENGRKVRAMYTQIKDWLQWPAEHELLFNNAVQRVIDSSIGRKLPGFAKKGLHTLKSKDPVGAARSAAFHGLLGWFNPAQYWIQAQGATVALSLNMFNPAEFGRVWQRQSAIQALQHVSQTEKNIGHVAKAFGMNVDELRDINRAWKKSGLEESILQTADHAAAMKGHGIGGDAIRRAADAGLFFYRPGEMWNRRFSFATAYGRWKNTAEEGARLTDEALKEVLRDTNNIMLNMGKAARASWQRGVFGIPTQFMQINARTIETLLGMNGNFTLAERGKIFGGQLALYGSAGVPLGGMGANWFAEMMGWDQKELQDNTSPEMIKAINEGFVGWATLAMFGADIDISNRSSLMGQMDEMVDDLLFREGTSPEKFFGAFGTTGLRFWQNMLSEIEPISLGVASNRPIDIARMIANPFLRSISTFRNADRAYFMHAFDKIVDNNYQPIEERDYDLSTELFQLAGFSPRSVAEYYDLSGQLRNRSEARKTTIKEIANLYYRYASQSLDGTLSDEDLENYRNAMAVYMQAFDNADEQRRIAQGVRDRLTSNPTLAAKWKEYRTTFGNGNVDNLYDLSSKLRSTGLLRDRTINEEAEQGEQ